MWRQATQQCDIRMQHEIRPGVFVVGGMDLFRIYRCKELQHTLGIYRDKLCELRGEDRELVVFNTFVP